MPDNTSQRAGWPQEISLAATSFNGTLQNIGTGLTENPVHLILDNQTDVAVPLYVNSVLWKTFSAGQALILDMRGNHGIAANFTADIGTQFGTNASLGTSGSFRISLTYAR